MLKCNSSPMPGIDRTDARRRGRLSVRSTATRRRSQDRDQLSNPPAPRRELRYGLRDRGLEQLSPQAIQRWLTTHKTEHGARRRIVIAHAVLRSALSEA